jgi:hypothetical protein
MNNARQNCKKKPNKYLNNNFLAAIELNRAADVQRLTVGDAAHLREVELVDSERADAIDTRRKAEQQLQRFIDQLAQIGTIGARLAGRRRFSRLSSVRF